MIIVFIHIIILNIFQLIIYKIKLNDKLDSMIMESRKNGDSDKLRVLQAIKPFTIFY